MVSLVGGWEEGVYACMSALELNILGAVAYGGNGCWGASLH